MGICKRVQIGKQIGRIVLGIAIIGLGLGMKHIAASAEVMDNTFGITTNTGKNMSFTAVKDSKKEAVFSINSDGSARLKSGSIGMGADSTIHVGNIKIESKNKGKGKKKKKVKTISLELVTDGANQGIAIIKTGKKNTAEITLEEGDTITANGGVTTTAGKGGAVLKVSYSTRKKKAVFELLSGTTSNEGDLVVALTPGDTKIKLPIGVEGPDSVMVTAKKDGTYRVKITSAVTSMSLAEETYKGNAGTIVYTIDTDSNVYVDSITLQPGDMTDEIMTGGKRMTVSNVGLKGAIEVKSGNLATIQADSGSQIEVGIGKKSRNYTVPDSETGKVFYRIHKDNKLEEKEQEKTEPSMTPLPSGQSQFFSMSSVYNYFNLYSGNTEVGKIVEIDE